MAHHPSAPMFLTPKEVAARWRLGLSTVYALKDAGQLAYVQVGGAIRFKLADVLAYEEAGYQRAVMRPKALRGKRRRVS
jgi:excisionase family DNA binding protein